MSKAPVSSEKITLTTSLCLALDRQCRIYPVHEKSLPDRLQTFHPGPPLWLCQFVYCHAYVCVNSQSSVEGPNFLLNHLWLGKVSSYFLYYDIYLLSLSITAHGKDVICTNGVRNCCRCTGEVREWCSYVLPTFVSLLRRRLDNQRSYHWLFEGHQAPML